MCIEFPVQDLVPFFSVFISLWLSWSNRFCVKSYPWTSVNRHIQLFYGRQLLTPTTSASVEPFLLNFFLLELKCISAQPNDMPPPVWIFRSGCTLYATSNPVHSRMRLSYLITFLLFIFGFNNSSSRFSFALSYTVLLVTLEHRNDISG